MHTRLRDFCFGLAIVLLTWSSCEPRPLPASNAIKRVVAQMPANSTLSETVYTVTDASAFPALPLPANSLIFRNGILTTSSLDYTIGAAGTTFAFNASANLQAGEQIEVVTFP